MVRGPMPRISALHLARPIASWIFSLMEISLGRAFFPRPVASGLLSKVRLNRAMPAGDGSRGVAAAAYVRGANLHLMGGW